MMPIFGGSPVVDFMLLLLPFAAVGLVSLFLQRRLSIAPTGLIVLGVFSILTKFVEYRTYRHEGASAVFIGCLYVAFGAMVLVGRMKKRMAGSEQ